ncbi:MAG: PKD domain-containing protein [Promethearchaeota archaeon]
MRKAALIFGIFVIILFLANIIPSASSEQIQPSNSLIISPMELQSSALSDPILPIPPPSETVAIIVQNTLYSSVSSAVTQYRADLNNTGYNTILYTQTLNTVQELKSNLTSWYNTHSNFKGAVLIGRLPYAEFYHPASGQFSSERFICDLYLMDLDGNWYDTITPTGAYDVHNASAGADTDPEIYVGRIDPTCLTWGTGTANHINTYLARAHSYRIGSLLRQHRALVYVDDDWSNYWSTLWDGDVGNAFSTRTLVNANASTTAADWLNRIALDYKWAHLCAHSTATSHQFHTPTVSITSTQVRAVPPAFNFYNLFCCHGAEWTISDNIAVTYVFSGSYGLGAIGSSKTGGMMDCQYFYSPLGQNQTLGDGFKNWWINGGATAGSYYIEWYYGMNIIGDPFLTTHHDVTALPPTISSTTHPDPSQWSNNPYPQFNWSIPIDVNSIAGYYYILDQNPTTIPTATTGTYTTINGTLPTIPLIDGTWYLHVVSKDSVGNIGSEAAHYQVNIDITNPSVTITAPNTGDAVFPPFDITWSVIETGSGYSSTDIYLNGSLFTTIIAPVTNATISNLIPGTYLLNVTVFDTSGLSSSHQITVIVLPPLPPGIPGFPFEAIALGAILAVSLGVVYRRHRR